MRSREPVDANARLLRSSGLRSGLRPTSALLAVDDTGRSRSAKSLHETEATSTLAAAAAATHHAAVTDVIGAASVTLRRSHGRFGVVAFRRNNCKIHLLCFCIMALIIRCFWQVADCDIVP